jgi:phosphoesterase RecJ-like protein
MPEYRFLPGTALVGSGPEQLRNHYDAVFVVDSGSWDRIERLKNRLPKDIFIINIDHHSSNQRFGDINWIDTSFSSTGEMIYELIKHSGIRIDMQIAINIYVALLTDTGRFSFSNTNPGSHLHAAELVRYGVNPAEITREIWRNKSLAQLRLMADCINNIRLTKDGRVAWLCLSKELITRSGFVPHETQEYVDIVKSIKGVQIAVLFRELDEPRKIKTSFRSEASVDASRLAAMWGGGGHVRSAGATIEGTIRQVEQEVIGEILRWMRKRDKKA